MGTTRIKVIDLSQDVEQIKTSRKRAQTGAIAEIKKSLVKEKKSPKAEKAQVAKPEVKPEEVLQTQPVEKEVKKGKASKSKFAQIRGKKYQNAKLLVDKNIQYPLKTALELAKKVNIANFDASIEVHIVCKQKGIRGVVTLPHPVKLQQKILVFAKMGKFSPNGILVGNDQTISEILEKKLQPKKNFSLVIAEPAFMPKLAKLGKILGPAGLMPNPKSQTVTEKIEEAVKKFSQGAIEFKTESASPVIHQVIGKVSQETERLTENLLALVKAIGLPKIAKIYLSPTMGPSIKVDLASIQ